VTEPNPPVKLGKVKEIIHYKGDPNGVGKVGVVVDVVAQKPCVIVVYEVENETR